MSSINVTLREPVRLSPQPFNIRSTLHFVGEELREFSEDNTKIAHKRNSSTDNRVQSRHLRGCLRNVGFKYDTFTLLQASSNTG